MRHHKLRYRFSPEDVQIVNLKYGGMKSIIRVLSATRSQLEQKQQRNIKVPPISVKVPETTRHIYIHIESEPNIVCCHVNVCNELDYEYAFVQK